MIGWIPRTGGARTVSSTHPVAGGAVVGSDVPSNLHHPHFLLSCPTVGGDDLGLFDHHGVTTCLLEERQCDLGICRLLSRANSLSKIGKGIKPTTKGVLIHVEEGRHLLLRIPEQSELETLLGVF